MVKEKMSCKPSNMGKIEAGRRRAAAGDGGVGKPLASPVAGLTQS
jgi:hypothetical protein